MDRLIAGRYELLGRLGTGGAATVYRARDVRLDRTVAVKVLHEQLASDPDFLARLQREARVAASLNHPNVVDVYDYGAEGDTAYIVMPFVGGGSLKERILAQGRLTATEATDIARQVLSALAAAHANGLVHRDVKPQNVLLTTDGIVKLADFGIVHMPAQAELTQQGTTIGTAAYIAPEQATGGAVGPQADIYAVGLLLYEMLVGRPPFVGGSPMEVAYRQVNEMPVPPRQLVPTVPPRLDAAIMRALSKDPGARFPSAEAMLQALDSPVITPAAEATAPMTTVRMPVTRGPAATPPAPASRSAAGVIVTLAILGLLAALGLAGALVATRLGFLSGGAPPTPRASASPTVSPRPTATAPARAVAGASPSPAAGTPTATLSPTATLTHTTTPTVTLTLTRPASPSATITPTRSSTPSPPTTTPTPQLRPVTTPTQPAPPTPTLPPPVPVATPKPGIKPGERVVEIPDTAFQGGFRTADGNYRGQSATLIYGSRTQYAAATARFEMPPNAAEPQLRLTGLDSEDRSKTQIEMLINDRPFFRGPSPFVNDVPASPIAPWSEQSVPIPGGFLREGQNTLTIRNRAESNNLGPPFVAIHQATIVFRG